MKPRIRCRLIAVVETVGIVSAAALLISACGSSSPTASASPAGKTISYAHVVDLSHVDQPADPSVAGRPQGRSQSRGHDGEEWLLPAQLTIGEHSATHMNAPNSFVSGNTQAITSYPPEQRVVPAVVIDARAQCQANADYQLSQQDVLDWEAKNGKIAPGSFVIMYTGWQDKWNDPTAFINLDAKGNLHFPGFAGATSKWLVTDRQIAGVGIDTHGVDPGSDTSYATNTEMANTHKIAIECMANLDKLPAKGATLVLAPLQLQNGSGSPMDILAFLP